MSFMSFGSLCCVKQKIPNACIAKSTILLVKMGNSVVGRDSANMYGIQKAVQKSATQ